MIQPSSAELSIGVNDQGTSDADFLALRAEVNCRGFSGRTAFIAARRDIALFIADAASLSSSNSDSALLLGGWEKAEQPLRLQLTRAGLSGQFIARVRVATNGPRTDQWNRVETDFVAPADAFTAFVEGLGRVSSGAATSATLTGDADAIG